MERERMLRRLFSFIVAATLAAPATAIAQTPAVQTAETFFNRAKEHADRQEWRAACPLYAESLRADPQTGTLLRLADCEEHTGALSQALARWREAIDKLGGAGNEKFLAYARKRADDLDARVPRFTLAVAPGAPAGTRVLRGGEELSGAALGVPMAVNPGAIEVVVIAPGREERRSTVELAEKDRKEITVEPGAEVAAPPPVVVKAVVPAAPEPSWGHRHRASLSLMGLAVVGAGAGAGVGAVTKADYFALQKTCPGPCMPPELDRLHRALHRDGRGRRGEPGGVRYRDLGQKAERHGGGLRGGRQGGRAVVTS
jgi:hypothetical protein